MVVPWLTFFCGVGNWGESVIGGRPVAVLSSRRARWEWQPKGGELTLMVERMLTCGGRGERAGQGWLWRYDHGVRRRRYEGFLLAGATGSR